MRDQLLITFLLLQLMTAARGQDISRQEADSLLHLLSRTGTDTARIRLLLKVAEFHIFKPGEFKTDLDSAATFINDAKRLGIRSKEADGDILLAQSYLTKERGQNNDAKGMVEKAIGILKDGNDKSLLGEAYLALTYYYTVQNAEAIATKTQLAEQALEAFRQSGRPERIAFCLTLLADLHTINNEDAKALHELKLALEIYDSIHYDKIQEVYVLLSRGYWKNADYSDALRYDLMALKAAEMVHDSTMTFSQINNDIGALFVLQNENEKALPFYNKGLAIAEKYRDTTSIFLFALNITDAYVKLHKPLDALRVMESISKKYPGPGDLGSNFFSAITYMIIYMDLKQYPRVQPYCNALLKMVKGPGFDLNDSVRMYSLIIRFYIASGQYSSALTYLIKNKGLTRQLGTPHDISENYREWVTLDSALHDYRSALYNLMEFNKINDSVYNQSKSRQIQLLQVEYETEKKDQNIQLLSQKERLQKADLDRSAIIRNVTFGGLFLLLLLVILLYRQYKIKQRSNKVISMKNDSLQHLVKEKEWLVKEIHHRVKNNLQTIISLLESQGSFLSGEALLAIQDSQNRVYAMSLLHQKLYQQDNTASINMQGYIADLVNYLRDSYNIKNKIRFQLEIAPIELDISQAVPLGLILNEAITNSIKYAFTGQHSPGNEIRVSMRQFDHIFINFTVSDNGHGWPVEVSGECKKGLGFELMKGLTGDIGGEISFQNQSGAIVSIDFTLFRLHEPGVIAP
jgi:two-component system, sensor histidine kinase PdtaS